VTRRILVLARNARPDAASVPKVTWDLASGLRMRRWEVTLLTTGTPGRPREYEHDGLHIVTLPLRNPASQRRWEAAARRLVRDLGVESFDATVGSGPAGEAVPVRGSPFVFQCQAASLGRDRTRAPLGAWGRRRPASWSDRAAALRHLASELSALQRADAVVVPRLAVKEALAGWPYRLLPKARQARIVRHGVDARRFHPHAKLAASWRRRHAVAETAPLVVTSSRLDGQAGVQDALAAFRLFLPRHPEAKLVVGGDGPAAQALRRRARALRLPGSVAFAGEMEPATLVRWLQAADLVLFLPRSAAAQPTASVLESLACGPDVVVASPALDLARPHPRLHAVPACDPRAVERAMEAAWQARRRRRTAPPFPVQWTLGRTIQGYEAVLEDAMDGGGRSSRLNGGLLSAGTGSIGDRLRGLWAPPAAAGASGPPRLLSW
jgi:glycosyltransferase involved in cell wall biosynthesis